MWYMYNLYIKSDECLSKQIYLHSLVIANEDPPICYNFSIVEYISIRIDVFTRLCQIYLYNI